MIRQEIRLEQPPDYRAVEELTREAFWNLHAPGCDEHYLAHVLRSHADFLPELDFVAAHGAEIVGNIMFTRSRVEDLPTITFGPISVLPVYQRMGIGSALIRHALAAAREMGHRAVLIFGDPAYYARFGFLPGKDFGIRTADDMYAAALQALELAPGSLDNVRGRFFESDAFEIDVKLSEKFDRQFSSKPRLALAAQAEFRRIADMREPFRGQ